ncbi:hypothetical protein KO465_05160 [Candidatus Micrarchaeota archaeon]|nr:hypothetical protein [Candidatus Micrarchaeota archaeon]
MKNVAVVGVGDCGTNSVLRLRKQGMDCEMIAVCDSERAEKIEGKGVVAVDSENADLLKLKANTSTVFVINGIGGKTGTFLAPEIAKKVKETGSRVVSIAFHPFPLEKERCAMVAGFVENMEQCADEMILVKNNDYVEKYPGKSMSEAFELIDKDVYENIILKKGR